MIKRLTGTIQPYAWGSRTMIPELLGLPPTGEPQAELWLGAHPMAPSLAEGERLDQLVAENPVGVIGARPYAVFGPRLPFLMKIIAADRPLSLQAHPTRAQAEAGFAEEESAGIPAYASNRTYRDTWPKPEVLCALGPTEALCGFRDPSETYQLFEEFGVPGAVSIVAALKDASRDPTDRLKDVFRHLLRLSGGERAVIHQVAGVAESFRGTGAIASFAATIRELSTHYPADPGVLAALLMNRITLHRHDAIFLAAGKLHAYMRGGGVEIMANSDNVMRGGLTPKFINVDELLKVLDFRPGVPDLVRPTEQAPGIWHYAAPAEEFSLWRLDIDRVPIDMPGTEVGRIVLVTDGSVQLESASRYLGLSKGESALITAGDPVSVRGSGTVFVGSPGLG